MPIITKPYSAASISDFSWNSFTRDSINGNYILVVGNEAILNKEFYPKAKGNSLSMIFDLLIEQFNAQLRRSVPESPGVAEFAGLTSFNKLCQSFKDVRNWVLSILDCSDFEAPFDNEFEPSLMNLLATKCFRVVLTTTIDPYLEIAMKKVWGENGFRTISIFDTQNDLAPSELRSGEFNEIMPTLYYVFGKADKDDPQRKFVLSENDAMSTIARWYGDKRPKELLKYITGEGMKLLSVGCRFDDWPFRFFWYVMRGDISKLSSGQVAVEFDDVRDKNLKEYLINQRIKVFDDARQFMKEATQQMQTCNDNQKAKRKQGGIFISYAHEDAYIALPLFNRLVEAGFNVWFDERLNPGDDYNTRITDAINSCKVFVPILSSQVMSDLTKGNDRYYMKEWEVAQSRYDYESNSNSLAKMQVVPILVGRYQLNSTYHQEQVPVCIKSKTAFEASKDTSEELIRTLTLKM
ncbi:MAG: toll/interleukin-1 receptor domain-containing protein [Muribaculaceae bacterium]|nr:toll/interleukin-1 receptor domain-containing protein [Muribaculaceae bacterium]